jgi:hypothetical protein
VTIAESRKRDIAYKADHDVGQNMERGLIIHSSFEKTKGHAREDSILSIPKLKEMRIPKSLEFHIYLR